MATPGLAHFGVETKHETKPNLPNSADTLDLIHIFILVSKTVFISVYTPLVAILFSASAQLISSDLLFGYGGWGGGGNSAGGRPYSNR